MAKGINRNTKEVGGVTVYECTACHQYKEKDSFHKSAASSLGILAQCKDCIAAKVLRNKKRKDGLYDDWESMHTKRFI